MVDKYDFCVIGEGLPACLSALMVQARAPQTRVILSCFPDRVFRPPFVSLSPVFERYLKFCDVNLTEIFAQGSYNRLAASRFINWGAFCRDHTQAWSEYGGPYSAVPFHELLSACSRELETKPIDYYCLAKRASSSGVTLSAEEDPRSIKSTLKYGYLFNRRHLQQAIISQLKSKGAVVVYPDTGTDNRVDKPLDEIFDLVYEGIESSYSCRRKLLVYSSSRFDPDSGSPFYYVTQGRLARGIDSVDYIGGNNAWLRRSGLGDHCVLEVMASSCSESIQLAGDYWSSQNKAGMESPLNEPESLGRSGRYEERDRTEGCGYFELPVPRQPMIHLSELDYVIHQLKELSDYLFCDSDDLVLSGLWNDRLKSWGDRFLGFNKLLLAIKNGKPELESETGSAVDRRNRRLVSSFRERGILPAVDSYPLSKTEMGALLYGLLGPSLYNNPLVSTASEKPRRFLEAIDRAITKAL